jgi:hypothetical protein
MLTSGDIFGIVIGCFVFLIMCIVFYNMTSKKPESEEIPRKVKNRRKVQIRKKLEKVRKELEKFPDNSLSGVDNSNELP